MRILSFLLLAILVSCSNAAIQSELETTKLALQKAESALKTANQQLSDLHKTETGQLVHIVFFKVKAEAKAEVIAEIKKLKSIPVIQDLEVGTFENLADPRALSDYNLVMEMSFADKAAYELYQKHPHHLALKDNTKSMMAGPPATYDYVEK